MKHSRRLVLLVGATVGLLVITALLVVIGVAPVGEALVALGWSGFAAVCLIHVAVICGMGLAWRAVVPQTATWILLWARLVRDAGGEILPFSQLGGLALGARAALLAGLPAATAAASTVVDVTLELLSKLAYLALGLVWLVHSRPPATGVLPLVLGLAATGAVAVALCAVQRHGFAIFDWLVRALAGDWAGQLAAGATVLQMVLADTYRRRLGVGAGFIIHLACWIASTLEVWVALRVAGTPLDFGVVMGIESLLYGFRTFAFAIPNAIGAQEAGYVFIGATFGLTPEMALALSLLKRARDLAIGLPTLGVWQLVEGKRAWRRHIRAEF